MEKVYVEEKSKGRRDMVNKQISDKKVSMIFLRSATLRVAFSLGFCGDFRVTSLTHLGFFHINSARPHVSLEGRIKFSRIHIQLFGRCVVVCDVIKNSTYSSEVTVKTAKRILSTRFSRPTKLSTACGEKYQKK